MIISCRNKILSDKKPWNDTVLFCPINNLYVEGEKRDWNEVNDITQLDLEIISLGKKWDDLFQEEGRDALFVSGYEKDPLAKQNINLLQINGQPIVDKWLEQMQPENIELLDILAREKELLETRCFATDDGIGPDPIVRPNFHLRRFNL